MSKPIAAHFTCTSCNKQFTWKPQLAGKRAKCTCGSIINVPSSPPDDSEPDLYDFAEASPAATSLAAPPYVPPAASTIAYHSAPTAAVEKDRFAFSNIIQPPRDLYVPLALL